MRFKFKSPGRPSFIEVLECRRLLSAAFVATGLVAAELDHAIQFAQAQLTQTESSDLNNNPNLYPTNTLASGGWSTADGSNWSAGAFPASLWEMYLVTGDPAWKTQAQEWTAPLAAQDTQTSDQFLRIYDPFIYDYQLTGDPQAAWNIITAAEARLSNFNANVGAWQTTWMTSNSGNPQANFGVLIDQSLDAQEVFWAAQQTGNATWLNQAADEMTTVEKYLVRPDGSTAQWAFFDADTGQFIDQETFQGYSAGSTWSRGQAWAINSFASAYASTQRADFLATDESVANYFINNLPSDYVPYWDFNVPGIPNTYRDTSAAAIGAAGLLQLAKIDPNADNAQRYYLAAQSILGSLSTTYLAEGSASHGILLHGAALVSQPGGVPDASLSFGDYYFLQAADLYLNQAPVASAPAAMIADGGFEGPAVGQGYPSYVYNPTSPAWTFNGDSGVTGNDSGFTAGNPSSPQAAQVAFLQMSSTISQVVNNWQAGTYALSFSAAQRLTFQHGGQDFQVLVDNTVVGTFTPATINYAKFSTNPFAVTAGSHTITFQGLDTMGGDNTAFIDDVDILPAPAFADGGFETPALGQGYMYNPTSPVWIFAGDSGVTGNESGFTNGNPPVPQGSQVAFLQMTSTISQVVSGWQAGNYALTFSAAQRQNYQHGGQDLHVLVDNIVMGTFTPSSINYADFATNLFALSAGSHTITFQGLDTLGGDNTAFIDHVRIALLL